MFSRIVAGSLLVVAAVPAVAGPTPRRELLMSANDGKPVRPGDTAADTVPDTLSVLEVTAGGVRLLASVAVPASMTGPPESVRVTPDGRYAILTSAQQAGASPPALVPGNAVSVVDLSDPAAPRVVQRTVAGAGAAGVAIDPAGRRVLVANGAADTVSAFTFADGRLVPAGTIALPAKSKPVSVRFARDGRSALVAGSGAGRVFRLAVRDGRMVATGDSVATGRNPFGMTLSADGRILYVANADGDQPPTLPPQNGHAVGTLAMVEVASLRLLGSVPLGNLPENVALSPSGRWLQTTLVNGTQLPIGAPGHSDTGRLRVFRIAGTTVTPVAEIATGALCQGGAWSRDERRLMLQCAGPRTIELYRFDGRTLTRDPAGSLAMPGRPGAIAGVRSR